MNEKRKNYIFGLVFILFVGICLTFICALNLSGLTETYSILEMIYNLLNIVGIISGIILLSIGFYALTPWKIPNKEVV